MQQATITKNVTPHAATIKIKVLFVLFSTSSSLINNKIRLFPLVDKNDQKITAYSFLLVRSLSRNRLLYYGRIYSTYKSKIHLTCPL